MMYGIIRSSSGNVAKITHHHKRPAILLRIWKINSVLLRLSGWVQLAKLLHKSYNSSALQQINLLNRGSWYEQEIKIN